MNFIERVLQLISEKNITKNKLLIDLNLSKNSFVDWHKRGNMPNGETLIKIADYFNVSVDYLLGRETEPNANIDDDDLVIVAAAGGGAADVEARKKEWEQLRDNLIKTIYSANLTMNQLKELAIIVKALERMP